MNVTEDVIMDLFPLYQSGEATNDTKQLVDEYLRSHPEFERRAHESQRVHLPHLVSGPDMKNSEQRALVRTKRLLRIRGTILAFAIFFSLAPFSFLHTEGRSYFLFTESPRSALAYGVVGVCFWIGYFFMKRSLRVTSL